MDKVKHEIEAALVWLEEGNIERVKLHLGFALQWRNDEASQQERAADVLTPGQSEQVRQMIQNALDTGSA